jgi:hypothetical protein
MPTFPPRDLYSAWTSVSTHVRPGIPHKLTAPSTLNDPPPSCMSSMGRESEESSLPSLQHLMLHEEQKDRQSLPLSPYNGLVPHRSPQVIRRTASMDVHQSPRRRITSSSLFDLLNDDSSAANTTTPPRDQRGGLARIPRSCSPDETPRASDVSRFGSSTQFMPRNPVLGASPPQPAGFLGGRQASIPAHLPPPPFVRRTSDPLSEAESSFSGYSEAEPSMRRSFSTTSSASSIDDHELNFRPLALPNRPLVANEGQRLTPPDKRSEDSFFSSSYSSASRPVATPGSSRAPISRTTKACNACRSRKVRCDAGGQAAALVGSEMPCSRCKDAGLTCVYSAQQRKRGPTPGTRRGESATKTTKRAGEGNETPSRRPSAISTRRPSHFDDDPTITTRMLNRPTPYRSASISTYSQGPHGPSSIFDSRAPSTAHPYPHDMHLIPQHDNMYSSPPVPSPTWTNSLSNSSASTSPNTPYLPTWSQMGIPPGSSGGPLITPPAMLDGHSQRPASPAIMGWAGSAIPRGKTPPDHHQHPHGQHRRSPQSRNDSYTHAHASAVARERASAEEEAFRNGYTMAFAQFQRQKDLDRGIGHERRQDRDRDLGSVRLPPISVGTGR